MQFAVNTGAALIAAICVGLCGFLTAVTTAQNFVLDFGTARAIVVDSYKGNNWSSREAPSPGAWAAFGAVVHIPAGTPCRNRTIRSEMKP
jgi:hypothetical protein